MESADLQIANLEVAISVLRKEERRLVVIIADDSEKRRARDKAQIDLRSVLRKIKEAVLAIEALEAQA